MMNLIQTWGYPETLALFTSGVVLKEMWWDWVEGQDG